MFKVGERVAYKLTKRPLVLILVIIYLFSLGLDVYAQETTGAADATNSQANRSDLISINMVNADIRDVLSTIAISMDTDMIYLEKAVKVSFSAKDIKPMEALVLLLQSTAVDDVQLSYLVSGDIIIVGGHEKLQKDFFNQLALTRLRLVYITPEELSDYLDMLEIPVKKITLSESKKFIWVQGTPQALAKVSSVIATLDRAENFDSDKASTSAINLTPFYLTYITADRLEKLIMQLDLDLQTLRVDTNASVLWVNGSQQNVKDIKELITIVDIPASAGSSYEMVSYKMSSLTYDKLSAVLNRIDNDVDVINVGSAQKMIWLYGSQSGIENVILLIDELDSADNAPESQFYIASVKNISPEDAKEKLEFLELPGVTVLTTNYPTLSRELLIKCSNDMIAAVSRSIARIDVKGQKIKAPIDYAQNNYKAARRKALICKMLDIPESSIFISDDIARDSDSHYYVLWMEDTPENLARIKGLVALIDAP